MTHTSNIRLTSICSSICVAWSSIAHAQAPGFAGEPRPEPAARGGAEPGAEVRFEPDDPQVTLLMQSGVTPAFYGYRRRGWYRRGWYVGGGLAPTYTPVCGGPCAARFAPGEYQFALERAGHFVPVPPVLIPGPATLRASYEDRSGERLAGLFIGIGGVIGGTIMIFASAHSSERCGPDGFCDTEEHFDAPLVGGGILVIVASTIVGAILGSQRDTGSITVQPLRVSSLEWTPGKAAAAPEGATLSMVF